MRYPVRTLDIVPCQIFYWMSFLPAVPQEIRSMLARSSIKYDNLVPCTGDTQIQVKIQCYKHYHV